jgi:hypothetical protein
MNLTSRYVTRHIVAYMGSLVALPLAWVGTSLITGVTDWLDEPIGCWFWCCRTHITLAYMLLPLCVVAEFVLVRRLRLSWWAHLPTMAVLMFVGSIASSQLMVLLLSGELVAAGGWEEHVAALAILGAQDVVWGGAYWSLLRAADIVLPPETGEAGESTECADADDCSTPT